MLKKLNKDENKTSSEVEFVKKNEFIYHMKEVEKLCISTACEKKIFKLTHDRNNHASHNKVYTRLMKSIYIFRLSRKIREYIKHCLTCELNQIKRHVFYEKLILIAIQMISFKIVAMNFIVTLLESTYDFMLTMTCKTFKKVTLIFKMFI